MGNTIVVDNYIVVPRANHKCETAYVLLLLFKDCLLTVNRFRSKNCIRVPVFNIHPT